MVLRERTRPIVDAMYDAVVDVVCETGSLVSLKIVFQQSFERSIAEGNPLVANVLQEGIPLTLG